MKKPTKEEIAAAVGKTLPDLITPGLKVLFCGINPGLYSAAVQHHFARPGNRFWPCLHSSGFIEEPLPPWREKELLKEKIGITNIAWRATASAAELTDEELVEGFTRLHEKAKIYIPEVIAVLGISAYRTASKDPQASYGLQERKLHNAKLWVLPSPSGLNAHLTPQKLTACFKELLEYLYE